MVTCDLDHLETALPLHWHKRMNNPVFVYSRNRKRFHKALSRALKRLMDRRIPRDALQDPHVSAWRKLYGSNNSQAMITLLGFVVKTFEWLRVKFEPLYKTLSPFIANDGTIVEISGKGMGRPRLMSAADSLALNLAWSRLRGSTMAPSLIFGMTGSSVSMYLRFGRRLVIHILSKEPDAAICVPSAKKIREYQAAIVLKHPSLMQCGAQWTV